MGDGGLLATVFFVTGFADPGRGAERLFGRDRIRGSGFGSGVCTSKGNWTPSPPPGHDHSPNGVEYDSLGHCPEPTSC